ncbi:MAG: permease [Pseudomonadota bacterium]
MAPDRPDPIHPVMPPSSAQKESGRHETRQVKPAAGFLAFFLLAGLFFLPAKADTGALNAFAVVFVSIVLEAIPFMFIGALAGGLIEAFVSHAAMASFLPQRGWLTVCMAAAAGTVFPVCECAVVPVVRRLVGKGLPLSAAIGYLLGGPIVNPIVAASTALAYGFQWRIVALRLVLGYGIAVCTGLLMDRFFTKDKAIREGGDRTDAAGCSCGCTHQHPPAAPFDGHFNAPDDGFTIAGQTGGVDCPCGSPHTTTTNGVTDKLGAAFSHAADDFMAVGHYLVIGAFISALAQTYIDRSSFLTLSGVPAVSVGLMMALAVSLNLCSEADAFIAASFQGLMPLPAQMAFMLIGPMFDLKLLLMYQSLFRRRAIVVLAVLIIAMVSGVSAGMELVNGMTP